MRIFQSGWPVKGVVSRELLTHLITSLIISRGDRLAGQKDKKKDKEDVLK